MKNIVENPDLVILDMFLRLDALEKSLMYTGILQERDYGERHLQAFQARAEVIRDEGWPHDYLYRVRKGPRR